MIFRPQKWTPTLPRLPPIHPPELLLIQMFWRDSWVKGSKYYISYIIVWSDSIYIDFAKEFWLLCFWTGFLMPLVKTFWNKMICAQTNLLLKIEYTLNVHTNCLPLCQCLSKLSKLVHLLPYSLTSIISSSQQNPAHKRAFSFHQTPHIWCKCVTLSSLQHSPWNRVTA